jgi:hypothetical protein
MGLNSAFFITPKPISAEATKAVGPENILNAANKFGIN